MAVNYHSFTQNCSHLVALSTMFVDSVGYTTVISHDLCASVYWLSNIVQQESSLLLWLHDPSHIQIALFIRHEEERGSKKFHTMTKTQCWRNTQRGESNRYDFLNWVSGLIAEHSLTGICSHQNDCFILQSPFKAFFYPSLHMCGAQSC